MSIYSIIEGCQPAQTQLRPTVTRTPLFNLSTAQIELEVKQNGTSYELDVMFLDKI